MASRENSSKNISSYRNQSMPNDIVILTDCSVTGDVSARKFTVKNTGELRTATAVSQNNHIQFDHEK